MSTQMSRLTSTSSRRSSATATQAIVPPTGPEKSVCMALRRAIAAIITPPLDCITRSGPRSPRSVTSWSSSAR